MILFLTVSDIFSAYYIYFPGSMNQNIFYTEIILNVSTFQWDFSETSVDKKVIYFKM